MNVPQKKTKRHGTEIKPPKARAPKASGAVAFVAATANRFPRTRLVMELHRTSHRRGDP